MTVALDVVGIGNALVDILDHKPHEFIGRHDLAKGTMSLIDEQRAHQLYGAMAPALEMSGGSAANTMVGIASLGGTAAYIGRVRDDQLGKSFAEDLRTTGVDFSVPPATDGPATGRCIIVVTPDAQRTMNTYLGASTDLGPGDVDPELIARAKLIYLEGYLWDRPSAKDAFRKAAGLAHEFGRRVALTLSDPFCVDRHRDSFVELIDGAVDVLFANEEEIVSLFRVASFDEAVRQVRGRVSVAALTRGARGAHDRPLPGDRPRHHRRGRPVRRRLPARAGAGLEPGPLRPSGIRRRRAHHRPHGRAAARLPGAADPPRPGVAQRAAAWPSARGSVAASSSPLGVRRTN
jgi:sugar/nucleoside kinase (ribokinase family)